MTTPLVNHASALGPGGWLYAQRWAQRKSATDVFISNAPLYWWYWTYAGLRPEVGYAQYAAETGWGKYGRAVTEDQHNPAGIKVLRPGADDARNSHQTFANWHEGVKAHANAVLAYNGRPAIYFPVHERLEASRRHIQNMVGKIDNVEEFSGLWAPSSEYGIRVAALVNDLMLEPFRGNLD